MSTPTIDAPAPAAVPAPTGCACPAADAADEWVPQPARCGFCRQHLTLSGPQRRELTDAVARVGALRLDNTRLLGARDAIAPALPYTGAVAPGVADRVTRSVPATYPRYLQRGEEELAHAVAQILGLAANGLIDGDARAELVATVGEAAATLAHHWLAHHGHDHVWLSH